MSRPNRQSFVPHSQPQHSFDNQGSNPRSYESQTDERGGLHGHTPPSHAVPDTYGGHYVNLGGPPLPPLRVPVNPQSQRRTERSQHVSVYSGQDEYDFAGLTDSHVGNYQTDPSYPGNVQGAQPTRPQDYYRARHGGEQWSGPDPGYQSYQQNASAYSMDQNVLPMGMDPGIPRRGMRRDASGLQPQGQPLQSGPSQLSPGGLYDYRSAPASASFWLPGPDGQTSYSSPSPSSSSDGSPNITSDFAGATVSLNPTEMHPYLPVETYLRQEVGIPSNLPVSLRSVADPAPGTRPTLTYKLLASLAIFESPYQKLSLQEIYQRIEDRFPWYRNQTEEEKKKWQGSLRHNLSLECIFRHSGRPVAEPGKGGYWTLTNRDGYGQKRLRKRRGRGAKDAGIKAEEEDQLCGDSDDGFNFAYLDDSQVGSSSGVQRTTKGLRSSYRSSPQPMSSSPEFPVAFGQPSFPPPASGPMRNLGQRMQSLPAIGVQSVEHQLPPTRPATVPVRGMHGYHSTSGREHGHYQGAMDVDEDSRRARGSRRTDGEKHRAYD